MASRPPSHEQGRHPNLPPLAFGHAGLVHATPMDGMPAGVSGIPEPFPPNTASVCDFSSPQSECDFLQRAISMQPPALQQNIVQAQPQPARPLPPDQAAQLQASLGQSEHFVAGQLFQKAAVWLAELNPPAYVQRWLSDGYSEYFPRPVPYISRANHPSTMVHSQFVTDQVQELMSTQAVEDVTLVQADRQQVAAVLPLTVADDGRRKIRLCWNGRHVNASLDVPAFRLEHAPRAAAILKPGDWLFTVDMKSGYHQIPLKPSFRKFCCFAWQGRVYRWLVLPFGLSSAPRAYTKLSRVVLAYWRRQGIRCSNYIDDYIFAIQPCLQAAIALRGKVLYDLVRFGWHISFPKSLLQPGQLAPYIGFEFITVPQPIVRVPARKVSALLAAISSTLTLHAQGRRIQGLDIARITGHLQSMRFAMAPVNLFTRAMYSWLGRLPMHPDPASGLNYWVYRPLSPAAALELKFWQAQLPSWCAAVVTQAPFTRVLYTDASGQGWGGLVHRVSMRREEPARLFAAQQWELVMSQDSVFTELRGLKDALARFWFDLQGQSVLHRTDSISTYYVVANAGSRRSDRLTFLAREIWLMCLQCSISLACEYVGADVIIRKGADYLSRWQDDGDCTLCPLLFAELWQLCGPFHVDRFASAANVQRHPLTGQPLPFWSRFLEPGTAGMDALTADWSQVTNYAFPPPSILDKVVPLIQIQRARTLLVAPMWPSALWWPTLLSMDPELVVLPAGVSPFLPQQSGCLHPLGKAFHGPDKVTFAAFWISHDKIQVRPYCRQALACAFGCVANIHLHTDKFICAWGGYLT